MFSMLENISIYTDTDNIELSDVLVEIHNKKSEFPAPSPSVSGKDLRDWFLNIVPNHDQEKVYTSDIKKLIKWYALLDEKGIIEDEISARAEEKEAEETPATETQAETESDETKE
jgi:hypothetical protein